MPLACCTLACCTPRMLHPSHAPLALTPCMHTPRGRAALPLPQAPSELLTSSLHRAGGRDRVRPPPGIASNRAATLPYPPRTASPAPSPPLPPPPSPPFPRRSSPPRCDRQRGGGFSLCLLTGDVGVGKTRTSEIASSAPAEGGLVAAWRVTPPTTHPRHRGPSTTSSHTAPPPRRRAISPPDRPHPFTPPLITPHRAAAPLGRPRAARPRYADARPQSEPTSVWLPPQQMRLALGGARRRRRRRPEGGGGRRGRRGGGRRAASRVEEGGGRGRDRGRGFRRGRGPA